MLFKIIALFAMLTDHAGILLYDNAAALRIIGRLAFPLFAWLLVYNYLHRTGNRIAYLRNVAGLALLSQPIYMISGIDQAAPVNVIGLLAVALMQINVIVERRLLWLSPLLFALSYFCEFGIGGYAAILALYFHARQPDNTAYMLLAVAVLMTITPPVAWPVVLLFFLLVNMTDDNAIPYRPAMKRIFYAFYPVHLAALAALAAL